MAIGHSPSRQFIVIMTLDSAERDEGYLEFLTFQLAHWAWPVRLASSGSEYNTGGMDKSGQNGADRKNSAAKENPRLAQLGTVDRGKPAERRMSTFKQAVPVTPGRRRSAARRYRPSMSRASRRRSTASKWGRGVYITVIVVGVLLAIGGGFGIGVALYPNILSSPSIQDALGSNPIDVQSDNSDDEEIIISDSPTSSTNQPRGKRGSCPII